LSYEPDFDNVADMRLLGRRRATLGLAVAGEPIRAILDADDELEGFDAPKRGAVLLLDITAVPNDGVIPGAIVTLALSVTNDGDSDADETVVAVPLPGGVTYRPGSFVRDGHAQYDDVAESFFGAGLSIGTLAAKTRATFVWKLAVRLGQSPLLIAPSARAGNAAIAGGRQLRIGRKAVVGTTAFAAPLPSMPKPYVPTELPVKILPFYELDPEEELVHEAADAALSPSVEPRPEPPPRTALLLTGTFERATHAFFSATFADGKAPSLLQHCIFGTALACAKSDDGSDAAGLTAHLETQSRLLHRIVLHERMGKKEPIVHYAGAFPERLGELAPRELAPRRDVGADGSALSTSAEIEAPARAVFARLLEERERWDFVKARQLTLALQAKSALGVARDANALTQADRALREYAQVSTTILQRLFVRMRVDGTTSILFGNEPQLDAAARALLGALAPLFD
jgi:uncharacterized repeat protein (TIGR01451 family)